MISDWKKKRYAWEEEIIFCVEYKFLHAFLPHLLSEGFKEFCSGCHTLILALLKAEWWPKNLLPQCKPDVTLYTFVVCCHLSCLLFTVVVTVFSVQVCTHLYNHCSGRTCSSYKCLTAVQDLSHGTALSMECLFGTEWIFVFFQFGRFGWSFFFIWCRNSPLWRIVCVAFFFIYK